MTFEWKLFLSWKTHSISTPK